MPLPPFLVDYALQYFTGNIRPEYIRSMITNSEPLLFLVFSTVTYGISGWMIWYDGLLFSEAIGHPTDVGHAGHKGQWHSHCQNLGHQCKQDWGPRCPSLKCPTATASTSDHASIPDAENARLSVVATVDQPTGGAAVPEGQLTTTAECMPTAEPEALAKEPEAPIKESDSESGRAESSSSDSDTDNLTDHSTCFKQLPRKKVQYPSNPISLRAKAKHTRRKQQTAEAEQPALAYQGNSMLKDAIQQLTQELMAMRRDFKTIAETQKMVVHELQEMNKQLVEINQYYQFVLEMENRKYQASAGLVEQCRAANQRHRSQQQAESGDQ